MSLYWVDTDFLGYQDSTGFDSLDAAVRYAIDYLLNTPWRVIGIRDASGVIYNEEQAIDAFYELERKGHGNVGDADGTG